MARRKPASIALPFWLESDGEPVLLLDGDGRLMALNPAAAEWLGVEGEAWRDRIPLAGNLRSEDPVDRRLAGIELPIALPSNGMTSVFALDSGGQPVPAKAVVFPVHPADSNGPWRLVRVAASNRTISDSSPVPPDDALRIELARQQVSLQLASPVFSLLGNSAEAERLKLQAGAAADSRTHLQISGPPGSERELLARSIHARRHAGSDRPPPLSAIQCRAADPRWLHDMVRQLLAARMAFDPPTVHLLLLDVERLDPGCQAVLADLLRSNGTALRLFSTVMTSAAAGPQDGTGDAGPIDPYLANHLSIQTINLPPLSRRTQDLPMMATAALDDECRRQKARPTQLAASAVEVLAEYHWPGDMLELVGTMTAIVQNHAGGLIDARDLPENICVATTARRKLRLPVERVLMDEVMEQVERELIRRALAVCGQNRAEAARHLGITRSRLLRRSEQLGILPRTERIADEPIEFTEAPPETDPTPGL